MRNLWSLELLRIIADHLNRQGFLTKLQRHFDHLVVICSPKREWSEFTLSPHDLSHESLLLVKSHSFHIGHCLFVGHNLELEFHSTPGVSSFGEVKSLHFFGQINLGLWSRLELKSKRFRAIGAAELA